jgi:hypothetical protein
MATFLELVQAVARESGTFPSLPTSAVSQSGRSLDVVNWVQQTWRKIQTEHAAWLWMQDEFEGPTVVGQRRYDGTDMGLTRWASFYRDPNPFTSHGQVSLYQTSLGVSDERPLTYVEWPDFYGLYLRGTSSTRQERPTIYAIDPARKLALWPLPDVAYTLRGQYRKSPQTLTANTDVPDMPAEYHDLIMYEALISLANFDEGMNQMPIWSVRAAQLRSGLHRDQLPRMRLTTSGFG